MDELRILNEAPVPAALETLDERVLSALAGRQRRRSARRCSEPDHAAHSGQSAGSLDLAGFALMTSSRRLLLFGLVAFVAALAGVLAGRLVVEAPRASETELHALLHRELKLSPAQQVKLDKIEAKFATRRDALELDMRAANIRLAQAIEAEHGYGPRVTEAIDETHRVMGELQKETLQHLFAMRVVLDPEQAAMFDKSVVRALTADAR